MLFEFKLEIANKQTMQEDLQCNDFEVLNELFKTHNGRHCVVRATVTEDDNIFWERLAKCEYIMAIDGNKARCLLNGCLKSMRRKTK